MGANQSKESAQNGQKLTPKAIQKLNLKPLIIRLKQKYSLYSKQTTIDSSSSQNTDLLKLQQEIRSIYMGLIKDKITCVNESKMTMQQCKIQISQEMLALQIIVFKHVENQAKTQQDVKVVKNFHLEMANFLVILARFLKTIYPRGDNVQAGQLGKFFKETDNTEEYDFDILKNAGFVFNSTNPFDITNTIKLCLNKIMNELDDHYVTFKTLIHSINPSFKVGRKISQNTSRYVKLDTGTVQIKSTEIARVLIKWMQDLSETLRKPKQKIKQKNEYKFYKIFPQTGKIQFSKCEQQTMKKQLTNGNLLSDLDLQKDLAKKKAQTRKSKFRKFNMHLMQVFNKAELRQSQVSKQMTEIIKYSAFNDSFIAWMVQEELINSIACLVQVGGEFQEYRGTLDLIKFKIFDLMRCQIFGDRGTIIEVYKKFQQLQNEDKLQIVRVKNRFSTPMGDAMVFLKFPQSFIICQCQLILSESHKDEDSKKAKNIQTLNHFIYELQRSPFGVLGQISVFLSAKSKIVSAYCDKIKLIRTNTRKIDLCIKQHWNPGNAMKFKEQKSPFLCSKCLLFFKKLSNKLKNHYCQKCIVFMCNNCMGQHFSITDEMIGKAINQKMEICHEELKRTKLYRQNPHQFDFAFKQVTPKQLMDDCLIRKNIKEVKQLKQNFKDGQLKVTAIIEYIHSKEDYVNVYMAKGVKVNFVIITWRGNQTRLKCYRYDNDEKCIQNVFQSIQRYETHQFIEVNEYDIFVEFISGGFCSVSEKNRENSDGFELKVRSLLERGLYLFEGQTKQTMTSILESIPQKMRSKYLMKYHAVNEELQLIVDIASSLKRSNQKNKIKQYLNDFALKTQQKKTLEITDMNITNATIKSLYDHSNWTNNVKNLVISDNNISRMKVILQTCKNLQKLNISRNRLKILRFSTALPNLVELDASQNSIQKVVNFYNITIIETVNFKSNKIQSLTRWVDRENGAKTFTLFPNMLKRTTHKSDESQETENKSFMSSFFDICQRSAAIQTQFNPIQMSQVVQPQNNQDDDNDYDYDNDNDVDECQFKNVKSFDKHGAYIHMRQMILANNKFADMNEFAQGYFPNITYLDLNDNLIQEIPALNLDKIQEIHLASNCIKKIDQFYQLECDSLTFLDLKNNKITQLPKFKLYNLTKVDLSYNTLVSCSDFITGDYFQNLTHLHLSHIKVESLTIFPKAMRVLSLQNCGLNDEQLDKLIKKFSFPKLKELYLTRNKLTKLPNIQNLQKINSIFLQENPIIDISIIFAEQQRLKIEQKQKEKTKKKDKKKDQDQDDKAKQVKKKGLYQYLSRLWISLNIDNNKKFADTSKQLKDCLVNTQLICWKFDDVFMSVQKPKRKFYFHLHQSHQQTMSKQLIIKRIYLLNIFENETQINNRFIFEPTLGLYSLQHQWDRIDMNEFIKYDWNEIHFINLTGTGMSDQKWKIFVENSNLFPDLKEIIMWEHKVTTITKEDLQSFPKLKKFSSYDSNIWFNPLSKSTKKELRKYKQKHPQVEVNFQEDFNNHQKSQQSIPITQSQSIHISIPSKNPSVEQKKSIEQKQSIEQKKSIEWKKSNNNKPQKQSNDFSIQNA